MLSLAAIATGVALGFCVHLVNGSAVASFSDAINSVSGRYDLEVVARDSQGFDDALYPRIAALPDVAVAAPSLEGHYGVPGSALTIHLVGLEPISARQLNPVAAPLLFAGQNATQDAAAIFVDPGLLLSLNKKIGDRITMTVGGAQVAVRIGGIAPSSDPMLVLMDIAAAQWRFNRLHRLSRIAIRRGAGIDQAHLRAEIEPLLPPDVTLASPEDSSTQTDRLSRAYRVNLDMLALMALFIGAFLVYSTQSLSVMRRMRQNALLRELGLTRVTLLLQVLGEGALLGTIGSVVGLGGGALLALLLLRTFGGDLGGGYFQAANTPLVFAPGAALLFLVLGIGAAMTGSFFPARAAQRNATAAALKAHDEALDPRQRPGLGIALLLFAAAALCTAMPAIGGVPVAAYLAMALLLFASIAAMPWLVRFVVDLTLRLLPGRSIALDLALRRLWAAPSQATVALCGIVASASLMVAMATMVSSFRVSVDSWLDQVLAADIYLRIEGPIDSFRIDQALQQRLAALPGASSVSFLLTRQLVLAADRPTVTLLIRDYSGDGPRGLPVIERASNPGNVLPVIWVSEAMVDLYRWNAGDIRVLPLLRPDGTSLDLKVRVGGVWRDYARQNGSIVIDAGLYQRVTGETVRSDAAFSLEPGASADQLRTAIMAALPVDLRSHAQLASPAEIRATSLVIFDHSFAITYLLEAVAIGIGLAGVAATFSAQTIARAREFGMLRHLGVQRREILAMLLDEGAGLGAAGVLVGFAVGLLQGQVLIRRVNPQSFHWTMDTHVPWPLLAAIALALLLASAGTALLSGKGALSGAAIRAVREDW